MSRLRFRIIRGSCLRNRSMGYAGRPLLRARRVGHPAAPPRRAMKCRISMVIATTPSGEAVAPHMNI